MKHLIDERKQFETINSIIQRSDELIKKLMENKPNSASGLYVTITMVLVFLHQVSGFLPLYFKSKKSLPLDFDLLVAFEDILTRLIIAWKDFDNSHETFKTYWEEFLQTWQRIYTYVRESFKPFTFYNYSLN
ncbi:MAG: hypothetical protein ACK4SO_01335 [Candidatus Kapaibacteriota bacterium]